MCVSVVRSILSRSGILQTHHLHVFFLANFALLNPSRRRMAKDDANDESADDVRAPAQLMSKRLLRDTFSCLHHMHMLVMTDFKNWCTRTQHFR